MHYVELKPTPHQNTNKNFSIVTVPIKVTYLFLYKINHKLSKEKNYIMKLTY